MRKVRLIGVGSRGFVFINWTEVTLKKISVEAKEGKELMYGDFQLSGYF